MTCDDSSACRLPQGSQSFCSSQIHKKAPAGQAAPRSVGGKSQNTDARQRTSTLRLSHTNRLVLQLLKLGQWLLDACPCSTVGLSSTNPLTLSEMMRTLFLRYTTRLWKLFHLETHFGSPVQGEHNAEIFCCDQHLTAVSG